MVDTREKFREMLNDIAATDGITKFNKLAEMTGINAVTFTRIKNNEIKSVSVDTFNKLNAAFGNRYNLRWFQGDSEYMLLSDVPEKDYGKPDFSSYINALLAKSDETIASLKRELAAKDEIIQAKNERISTLEELAEERLHRIAELRRVIDTNNMSDYMFPIGSAEPPKQKRV
jgi:transcriptional regulator with XRE-family HTH domain